MQAPDEIPALGQLQVMRLSELQRVAASAGISQAKLDIAMDADSPKQSMVQLICEAANEEDSDGEELIGPLSCYFPDALVYAVMRKSPAKDVSFIEAEQALLQSEGDIKGGQKYILEQRKRRADGPSHDDKLQDQMFSSRRRSPQSKAVSWMTTIASTVIIILVVASLLIVALIDEVIVLPDFVRQVLRAMGGRKESGGDQWDL